ncbi:insulin receptor substrate 4-like [Myiozetetes cayanensis]|uniref:insulin receptor substrate 4-like n=1 Tax=Myiozetetes cayanensis TaxID=478635 RepID=UPI00215E372C|nr:insulin receptor substrate 4-like [Myiozetetes cayanensis]
MNLSRVGEISKTQTNVKKAGKGGGLLVLFPGSWEDALAPGSGGAGQGLFPHAKNWEQAQGRGRGGGSALPSSGIAASPPGPAAGQGQHRQPEPFPPNGGPAFTLGPGPGGPEARADPGKGENSLLCRSDGAAVGSGAAGGGRRDPAGNAGPRDLARSVLETHGQDLRLLKLLGVARTSFDWGTHFSINFTARQPPCPKPPPDPRGCRGRPGRVQRCSAQVSVFTFLPDVPLSMVECGQEPVRAPGPAPWGGDTRVSPTLGSVCWVLE